MALLRRDLLIHVFQKESSPISENFMSLCESWMDENFSNASKSSIQNYLLTFCREMKEKYKMAHYKKNMILGGGV